MLTMKDKDIIKAVECCAEWDCCRCPRAFAMPNDKWLCRHQLMQEIPALLNRQNQKLTRFVQHEVRWNALLGFIHELEEDNNGN